MRTNAKPCALAQVVRRLRDFLLSLRRLPFPWFRTGKPILMNNEVSASQKFFAPRPSSRTFFLWTNVSELCYAS